MELPQNITMGAVLDNMVKITTTSPDCDTTNNRFAWSNTVVNSFDPNDKTLLNRHNAQGGILNDGAPLTYQIRFQNTGTAEALDIVVRDTLDLTHLDKTTFKIIGASHPNMRVRFEGNNIAVFEFPNINLIDSFHNEPASHGWLQFSIKPKANTPLYTVIDNTAAIFFDYNDPVITNTTHNTFVPSLVGTENTADAIHELRLQPNPATDILNLQTDIAIEKCEIYDVFGRVVDTIHELYQKNQQINVAHLPQGSYFIKVFGGNGSAVARFVKM
jgi:Secretion system C-terminal sorting domain